MKKPESLYFEITTECNLRCKQCHCWMTEEPPGTIGQTDRYRILKEFSSIARSDATVVFTGGEPFLKKNELLYLLEKCKELHLNTSIITNASLLSEGDCDSILELEPKYFGVSLDAFNAETHDWMRGVPGTFDHVTRFIRSYTSRLKSLRKIGKGENSFFYVASVLTKETLPLAKEMASYATQELGVDGISFQALNPTFANLTGKDPFYENHFPSDANVINRVFSELQSLVPSGKIYNTSTDLEWMRNYFLQREIFSDPVCDSANRNVIVNMYGDVQLCFSMKDLVTGNFIGNVKNNTLQEILESSASQEAKKKMLECRYSCGMLNCHVKQE